jgi:YrbI family 3-deoxy-D-manno-octulosonate 8-phosphate phosphatase
MLRYFLTSTVRWLSEPSSQAKLPDPIGLIVFDFDGVFTDNKVYTNQDGVEMVMCDRSDGLGLDLLRQHGLPMMILSTETNSVVAARAAKLKLPVTAACGDKAAFLRTYVAERGIGLHSLVYVGNDINDLEAMRLAAFTAAPANAHPEVRSLATLRLTKVGGHGAVREFCDYVLGKTRR